MPAASYADNVDRVRLPEDAGRLLQSWFARAQCVSQRLQESGRFVHYVVEELCGHLSPVLNSRSRLLVLGLAARSRS